MKRGKKGFALIELLVAIAAVGVMSVAVVPSVMESQNSSKESSDQSGIERLETELRMGTASAEIYKDAKAIADLTEEKQIVFTYVVNNNNVLVFDSCEIDVDGEKITNATESEHGALLSDYSGRLIEYVNQHMEPVEIVSEKYKLNDQIITLTFPDVDYKVTSTITMVETSYENYFDRPSNDNNNWNSQIENESASLNQKNVFFNPTEGHCKIASMRATVNEPLGELPVPTRTGYTFLGWWTSETGGSQVTESTRMGNSEMIVYAQWKEREDITYTVRYWHQKANGSALIHDERNYQLVDEVEMVGKTNEIVQVPLNEYAGFKTPEMKQAKINANGTTSVDYYYERDKFTVQVSCDINGTVTTSNMPMLVDVTVNGVTIARGTTTVNISGYYGSEYKLEIRPQGGYTLGATTIEPDVYSTCSDGVVTGLINDNTTVTVKLEKRGYYISYAGLELADKPVPANPSTYETVSSNITLINPTRQGYDFAGWTGSNGSVPELSVSIPTGSTGNKTFTANWKPSDNTLYKVVHWVQKLDGNANSYDTENYDVKTEQTFTGTTDSSVTPATLNIEGFTAPVPQSTIVYADGHATINYFYTRNKYNLNITKGDGIEEVYSGGMHYYGERVIADALVESGYMWDQWTGDLESTDQRYSFLMPAKETTIQANAKVADYRITYNLSGGSTTNPTSYSKTSPDIVLTDPVRANYIFLGWTGSNGEHPQSTVVIPTGSTGDKTYTANWGYDENGNGIPDFAEKTVVFKVVNGTWSDESISDLYVYVGLKNEAGEWDENGSGVLIPPYGMKPSGGYSTGIWDIEPPAKVSGNTPVTYTYTFTKLSYYIKFDGNGATDGEMETLIKETGIATTLPDNQYSRFGYTFVGWSMNIDGQVNFSDGVTISGDLTTTQGTTIVLYAVWAMQEFKIDYDLSDALLEDYNPDSYTVETPTFTLNNPTKLGYTFKGWQDFNTQEEFESVTIEQGTVGDKYFVALFDPRTDTPYKVEHYLLRPNGIEEAQDEENYELQESETQTFTGTSGTMVTPDTKIFSGYTAPEKITAEIAGDGSTVIQYFYPRNKYMVTIVPDNGVESTVGTGGYAYMQNVYINAVVKEGYAWNGWTGDQTIEYADTSFQMPAKNITLNATTKPIDYDLSYDYDGGIETAANPETYNIETPTFTLSEPKKDGYVFVGWIETVSKPISEWNDETQQFEIIIQETTSETPVKGLQITTGSTGARSYKALWEEKGFEITYDLQGGTVNGYNPTNYKTETGVQGIINPTRAGYDFIGWSGTTITSEDGYMATLEITPGTTGDLQFTAHWEARADIHYKVYHWLQNANGNPDIEDANNYTIYPIEQFVTDGDSETGEGDQIAAGFLDYQDLVGEADATVAPEVFSIDGYVSPTPQTVQINPDDSTVVNYYYKREVYDLSLAVLNGIDSIDGLNWNVTTIPEETVFAPVPIESSVAHLDGGVYSDGVWISDDFEFAGAHSIKIKFADDVDFGEATALRIVDKNGNNLASYSNPATNMPENELIVNSDYVCFIVQGIKEANEEEGEIGSTISWAATITPLNENGEGLVDPEGDTTVIPGYDILNASVPYGKSISLQANLKEGYHVVSWIFDDLEVEADIITFTMPNKDVALELEVAPNEDTQYLVKHWVQRDTYTIPDNVTDYTTIMNSVNFQERYENDYRIGETNTEIDINSLAKDYEGFIFMGPKVNKTYTIAGDGSTIVDLYYIAESIGVLLNPNGGTVNSGTETIFIPGRVGKEITLPTVTRAGQELTGYVITNSETGSTTDIGGATVTMNGTTAKCTLGDVSVTLTAQWKSITKILTVNPNGGVWRNSTNPLNISQKAGSQITIENPTRDGYTFDGWSLSGSGSLSGTTYTYGAGSGTLYAVWSGPTTLTVNYYSNYATYMGNDLGYGTNVSASTNKLILTQTFSYFTSYPSGLPDFQDRTYLYLTRTGYTPTGYWGTSTNGGTLVHQDTAFSSGAALANALGVDISNGSKTINIYVQWQ